MGWVRSAKLGIAWLLLVAGMATAQESGVKVKGRVLDGDGKPVSGADVGRFWSAGDDDGSTAGKPKQAPFGGTKTDGEGRFTVKVDFYGRDAALLAIDSSRTVGGTAVVPVADAKREVEIRLAPAGASAWQARVQGPGQADPLDQRLHQLAPRQDPATPEFLDARPNSRCCCRPANTT